MKWSGGRLVQTAVLFAAASISFHACLQAGWVTADPVLTAFFNTLKFHYMAVGALFACLLYYRGEEYRQSLLTSTVFRILTIGVLFVYYFIGIPSGRFPVVQDVMVAVFYGLLIFQVSTSQDRRAILEWRPLVYLGQISYGLYMYHMSVDYVLRMTSIQAGLGGRSSNVFPVLYGLLLLGITVGIAHLSYKHFEKPFLAFSHRARTAGALPAEIKIA